LFEVEGDDDPDDLDDIDDDEHQGDELKS